MTKTETKTKTETETEHLQRGQQPMAMDPVGQIAEARGRVNVAAKHGLKQAAVSTVVLAHLRRAAPRAVVGIGVDQCRLAVLGNG
jgi:hypothetical protein